MTSKEIISDLLSVSRVAHDLNLKHEQEQDLSLSQWLLMQHLIDMPAVSARSLAKALDVHPSSMTPVLKRLSAKKFIHISPDPRDTRRKLIVLTRAGRDKARVFGKNLPAWLKLMDPKARTSLATVVRYLRTVK